MTMEQSRGGRVAGKVALITGGTRGMGLSHGRVLAEHGARVVLGEYLASSAGRTHVAGELVTATRDRADQVWFTQGYAQRPDLSPQIALFYDPSWPDAADEFVFGDDGSVGLDQRHEHIKGPPAELYRPTVG